jgi:hypothetical protein
MSTKLLDNNTYYGFVDRETLRSTKLRNWLALFHQILCFLRLVLRRCQYVTLHSVHGRMIC